MSCEAETCLYWGGLGCVCAFMDIKPSVWHAVCDSTHPVDECPWENS